MGFNSGFKGLIRKYVSLVEITVYPAIKNFILRG